LLNPTVTEFSVPTPNGGPFSIASRPDGNIWFAEVGGNEVGRISPGGTITEFSASGNPGGIAVGPDGALWFSESDSEQNDNAKRSAGSPPVVTSTASTASLGGAAETPQLVQAMAGFGPGGSSRFSRPRSTGDGRRGGHDIYLVEGSSVSRGSKRTMLVERLATTATIDQGSERRAQPR
jgi:DNA-binding beta-propeller fold protein YncE